MKLLAKKGALRLLEFRDGLNVVLRGGTGDEAVMHEVLFREDYRKALAYISRMKDGVVLDMGGNIGIFSLLAARANPAVRIIGFEPGPENADLFRMNVLANPELKGRIELVQKGVAGKSGKAVWTFDAENPGGSGFYAEGPRKVEVELVAFDEVIREYASQHLVVKMDIEGSEFDVMRDTPSETWSAISAYTIELHEDPHQRMLREQFLENLKKMGFVWDAEEFKVFFATKKSPGQISP